MFESRIKGTGTARKYLIEPISTCIVDGLLSTRLHDSYSKSNPYLWFRDFNNDGKDEYAYFRFESDLKNLWPATAIRAEIESDINEFKYQYSKMWDTQNSESTAVRQISLWNQQNKYGFDDWYIPSITELNYIAANYELLNENILLNGDLTHEPMESGEYWSSTSVCRVTGWNENNHTEKSLYSIEQTTNSVCTNQRYATLLPLLRNTLSSDLLFNLGHQIANGQGMLIQNFADMTRPEIYAQKRTDTANLRPVRRIPIIVGVSNLDTPLEYNAYDFTKCSSCVGFSSSSGGSTNNGGDTSTTTFGGGTLVE